MMVSNNAQAQSLYFTQPNVKSVGEVEGVTEEKAIPDENQKSRNETTSLKNSALLSELSAVDVKVKAHEAAHLAAGGGIVTGGANFSYTRGPDGKMYATGGEVPIDASEERTPEATIQKARRIIAAALAPADPSPQDYKVAATAMIMEMKASLELSKEAQRLAEGMQAYRNTSGTA